MDSAAQTACGAVGDAETESSGDPQGCFKSSKEESDPGVSKPKSDKNKAARPLTLDCEVCDRSLSSGRHTAAAKHDIETQTFGDVNMAVDTASASATLVVPTCCKSSSEATRQAASSSWVDSAEVLTTLFPAPCLACSLSFSLSLSDDLLVFGYYSL